MHAASSPRLLPQCCRGRWLPHHSQARVLAAAMACSSLPALSLHRHPGMPRTLIPLLINFRSWQAGRAWQAGQQLRNGHTRWRCTPKRQAKHAPAWFECRAGRPAGRHLIRDLAASCKRSASGGPPPVAGQCGMSSHACARTAPGSPPVAAPRAPRRLPGFASPAGRFAGPDAS